jgi:hypothetical protein
MGGLAASHNRWLHSELATAGVFECSTGRRCGKYRRVALLRSGECPSGSGAGQTDGE